MKTSYGNSVASSTRISERRLRRRRNAMARRKLQDLHGEKVLKCWLAEVWDLSCRYCQLRAKSVRLQAWKMLSSYTMDTDFIRQS